MPLTIDVTDIPSWSVTASMESGLTASIELANTNNKYYIEDYLHKSITLTMKVNDVDKVVFMGYIVGLDPNYEATAQNNIAFSCVSIFNRLSRKPINTELYATVDFDLLLINILSTLCGYNDSYYDTTDGVPDFEFENICVNETSTIEALQKLAQASGQELFVNLAGILKSDDFTLVGDANDLVIPKSEITSAKLSLTDEIAFSTVRVRGGYSSTIDGPPAFLWPFQYHNPEFNQFPKELVYATYYTSAPDECFENAVITSADPDFISGHVTSVQNMNGLVSMYVQLEVDAGGAVQGSHNITITVTPSDYKLTSQDAVGTKLTNLSKGVTRLDNKVQALNNHPQRTTGSTDFRSIKPPDEKDVNRFESVTSDTTLKNLVGVLWTEIDNPYITNQTACDAVGTRYIQQYKQSRKIWEAQVVANTSIDLNQKVLFYPPESPLAIEGVIREINIDYQASNSSLLMSLKIEQLN